MIKFLGLSVLALACAVPSASAAVNFDTASVVAGNVAATDQDPGQYMNEEDDAYFFVSSLTISSSAAAANTLPTAPFTELVSASNTSSAAAQFSDAADGTVEFSGNSTAAITGAGLRSDANAAAAASGNNLFNYAFDSDVPFTITVTYTTSDNGVGANPIELSIYRPFVGGLYNVFLPVNGTGTTSFQIATPGTYALEIGNPSADNAMQVGAIGESNAVMDDHYSFAITPAVPEPATWLTMLIGFGIAGQGMRRRADRLRSA